MSLITWINSTLTSWIYTSTKGVTPVTNYRLSLITRQPPVIRHVSASRSLGSTVIWARAITTSPTDVTWDRLQSPPLTLSSARDRESSVVQFLIFINIFSLAWDEFHVWNKGWIATLRACKRFYLLLIMKNDYIRITKRLFFCSLSVRGSRYCLEFSIALGRPKMSV